MAWLLLPSLISPLLVPLIVSQAFQPAQDPLLEKAKYAAACPDYRTYSQYSQCV
jgi:hypothetical protein